MASTSLNRHLVAVGAAYVPKVVIPSIVLPATVYAVAVDSLSAMVLMMSPDEALVRPVRPAPVETDEFRIFTRRTIDPCPRLYPISISSSPPRNRQPSPSGCDAGTDHQMGNSHRHADCE